MKIKLLAKSSSKDASYSVIFTKSEQIMTIHCDCPAGRFSKLCKHKIELAMGNSDMLYDIDQKTDMDKVNKLAFQTDLFKELFKIKKIQNQIAEQQKDLRKQKKIVEKLMKNGANIT
jgi:hypothetical protein